MCMIGVAHMLKLVILDVIFTVIKRHSNIKILQIIYIILHERSERAKRAHVLSER